MTSAGTIRPNIPSPALKPRTLGRLGLLALVLLSTGCATMGLRAAVDLHVEVTRRSPESALVYIDDHYIGSLAAVAARGVRIVEGKHRVSIEKTGYFPYDAVVVSRFDPILLKVDLLALPQ